jgi:predicted dehydrogenase
VAALQSERTETILETFGKRADLEVTVPSGPIRIAFAGAGSIARIHVAALKPEPSLAVPEAGPPAVIVAACDTDQSRLAAFRAEHGVPATYRGLDELLQDARPDLVLICTPPHAHHEQALACIRAGISVLVEKPPVISLREFDELSAAERTAAERTAAERIAGETATGPGPWFASVFQHRFGSSHRRLKKLAADGTLGRPLLAVCHTTWFRDQSYFDVPWRGRWETEGGGPTMGHGIHQMDMLLDVLGEWTEVRALARRQARRTQTEDVSLAHVTFANGAVASVINSVLSPREESYLRFDFEHATVEVTHLYGYSDVNWRLTPAPDEPGRHDALHAAWQQHGTAIPSGHRSQFAHVLSCLAAGTRPPVAPFESRRTLSLVAAIYASAFTGHPVTPADLAPGSHFYDHMNGGKTPW